MEYPGQEVKMGIQTRSVRYDISLLTEHDIYLFRQGSHVRLYEKLGAHVHTIDNVAGVLFAVWAPNARQVSVVGDFNGWDSKVHHLKVREDGSGIWEGFMPGLTHDVTYKYHIVSRYHDYRVDKGDPFAFGWEKPPDTASRTCTLDYGWGDSEWMSRR